MIPRTIITRLARQPSGSVIDGCEPGCLRCIYECVPCSLNWQHAFHGILDGIKRSMTCVIYHRPALAQPVFRLFDRRNLNGVTFCGDEGKGFAPAYFYHASNMGARQPINKRAEPGSML